MELSPLEKIDIRRKRLGLTRRELADASEINYHSLIQKFAPGVAADFSDDELVAMRVALVEIEAQRGERP